MNNKITATFGADISEVEKEMIRGANVVKYYENAVNQVNKAEASRQGGGFLSGLGKDAPKAIGAVKQLAGAFGQAALAAGLVPGIGVAAIGVAGVVAGVNQIKEYYAEAAASAKLIAEYAERAVKARIARANFGQDALVEKEQVEAARKRLAELEAGLKAERRGRRGELTGVFVTREATRAEAEEIAKLKAEIEEGQNAIDKRKKESDEKREAAIKAQAKSAEAAANAENKQIANKIQDSQEKRAFDRLTDAEKIERLQAEIRMRKADSESTLLNRLKLIEAEDKLAEIKAKIAQKESDAAEKKAKADEIENGRADELAKLRYDAIWRYATLEQKAAQVRKEGREAQAKFDKDASKENQIALEKLKDKYRDLVDEAKKLGGVKMGPFGEPGILKSVGLERRENGKIYRGNRVVSEEDAARTIATRTRTERLSQESQRHRVESSFTRESQQGKNDLQNAINAAQVLIDMRDSLVAKKRE